MEHMERKITVFLFDMTVVLQGVFKGGDFSKGILNLVPSRDIHIECSKQFKETYTFMCLGRAGCFG